MKAGERVKIVALHPKDAFYHDSHRIVKRLGTVVEGTFTRKERAPYQTGYVKVDELDDDRINHYFYGVILHRVKKEVS